MFILAQLLESVSLKKNKNAANVENVNVWLPAAGPSEGQIRSYPNFVGRESSQTSDSDTFYSLTLRVPRRHTASLQILNGSGIQPNTWTVDTEKGSVVPSRGAIYAEDFIHFEYRSNNYENLEILNFWCKCPR